MDCNRHTDITNRLLLLEVEEAEDITEPVTLDEVKTHLAIEFSDHDGYLSMLIKSVRSRMEKYCNLSLVAKTVTLHINNSEGNFELPYGPVVGDVVVTDSDNEPLTDAAFRGSTFMSLITRYNEVRLTYNAGYTTIPADLKLAILHEIAYQFEHRGDESGNEGMSPIAKGYAKMHRRVPKVL